MTTTSKLILAAFIVFTLFLMNKGGFMAANPDTEAQILERRAIELCWKEQARKSLTPADQRFIARACETMESDFKTKWRREP